MSNQPKQKRTVTIFDVAKEAGVSYSTVSRVATGFQHVKPATREKVEAAMQKLGYVANLKARSLAGGRSQMIGLLVYDFETSYLVEIVRGIDREMSTLDYDMMLSTTHQRELQELSHVRKLTQGMVDGLLIMLPHNRDAWVEAFGQSDVPYMLIDYAGSSTEHANTVRATNFQGMYDATDYLIEQGHRKIGFLTGLMTVTCAQERYAGFKQALSDNALLEESAWFFNGDFFEPSGYQAGEQLAAMDDRPTALICSNDMMAFGVITALEEAGLSVPQDMSIVGFDDIPEASYFRPKLTTVRQPLQEMGRTATRALVQMIENPDQPPIHVELPTDLIVRASTAPPRKDS